MLWTPQDEERFVQIWYSHLGTLRSGRNQSVAYKHLQLELIAQGIDISIVNIKNKIKSFKRKYHLMLKKNKSQKDWKYFDKVAVIMNYNSNKSQSKEPGTCAFTSVYVNEVTGQEFNEEEYQKSYEHEPLPKKAKLIPNISDNESTLHPVNSTKKRNCWTLQEEEVFLDIWQRYARALQSDKKKTHVYKSMAMELRSQGIQRSSFDTKVKMESLTRKYRHLRDSGAKQTEWVHYSKVAELLPFEATTNDQFSEYSDTSSLSMGLSQFHDSLDEEPANEEHFQQSLTNGSSPAASSSSLVQIAQNGSPLKSYLQSESPLPDEQLESENTSTNGNMEDAAVTEHNYLVAVKNVDYISSKLELSEQFGQFVTKELNMLNADLLILAKKRIYDIICDLQCKQLKLNKGIHDERDKKP